MATLDDKIFGEKLQYYCSSSEDEEQDESDDEAKVDKNQVPQFIPEAELKGYEAYSGTACNTGPKGVIKDWQRYKQLQIEKNQSQKNELQALTKKLALTCQSELDAEKEKRLKEEEDEAVVKQLSELEDDFLKQYRLKRMQEMMEQSQQVPKFGQVLELHTGEELLTAIDKEKPCVTVIIHVHELHAPGCTAMNGCLQCLAVEYPTVKFCKIRASDAGVLSRQFATRGVPALLVYKAGMMIGNFIRLQDELSEDFFANELESFLHEHGILPEKDLIPLIIRNAAPLTYRGDDDESDNSDFDLD